MAFEDVPGKYRRARRDDGVALHRDPATKHLKVERVPVAVKGIVRKLLEIGQHSEVQRIQQAQRKASTGDKEKG